VFEYRATITRIVDGDTIDLDVDLGFHVHMGQRVRLAGINAPEKNTPAGKGAITYLAILLPIGTPVTIRSIKPPKAEKFGRWLADVTLPSGASISENLLATGHALAWDGKGTRPT